MDFKILLKTLGGLLILMGNTLFVPGFYSLFNHGAFTEIFFECGIMCILLGVIMWGMLRNYAAELLYRTGFAVVTLCWLGATLFGALPFYLTRSTPTFVDAFFESVSGFTGTGASVISNVEILDPAILLWRSLTHWLGGLGIVLFFLAVLPLLGIKGVALFRAEAAGPSKDRITPRVQETAKRMWVLYVGFTVLLVLGLWAAGMSLFDAVNHAMAAMATGGFSTKNAGIAFFNSATIDYILAAGMFLASVNFSLHYRLFMQGDLSVFKDTEFRWYVRFLVLFILALMLLNKSIYYDNWVDNLRYSVFTVVTTVSTTGFSNQDFTLWPQTTHLLIILLMVMGGMSGSTSGGLKCIRLVAAVKLMARELNQVIHPNALLVVKANQRTIPEGVLNAIWGFIFLYFLIFSIIASILTLGGLPIVEATSATFSALSGVGPGLGALGPMGTYSAVDQISKIALSAGMLLGRLEFYTVIVLMTPGFWKK